MGEWLIRPFNHCECVPNIYQTIPYLLWKPFDNIRYAFMQFEVPKIKGHNYCVIVGSINECFGNN